MRLTITQRPLWSMLSCLPVGALLAIGCGGPGSDAAPVDVDSGFSVGEANPGFAPSGAVEIFGETAGTSSGRVDAWFLRGAWSADCAARDEGPCTVIVCGATGGGRTLSDAGRITVAAGASTITSDPDAAHQYEGQTTDEPLWTAGGLALHVRSLGGAASTGVPSFEGDVTSPPMDVALLSPKPVGNAWSISRNQDLDLEWSAGSGADRVRLFLTESDTTKLVNVSCRFPAEAGNGVVPAAALSDLPSDPCDDGSCGNLDFYVENVTTVTAGPWAIELIAHTRALIDADIAAGEDVAAGLVWFH